MPTCEVSESERSESNEEDLLECDHELVLPGQIASSKSTDCLLTIAQAASSSGSRERRRNRSSTTGSSTTRGEDSGKKEGAASLIAASSSTREERIATSSEPSLSKPEDKKSLAAFRRKTKERVLAQCRLLRKKSSDRLAKPTKYSHIDVDAFLRWTRTQVVERQNAAFCTEPGSRPARVAVIGAGPVGLWISVLLSREHAHLADSIGCPPKISRTPTAPTVDLFEQRDADSIGSRKIVLALTNSTQDLLNHNLLSTKGTTSSHAFSPTASINFIESVLCENFQRYSSAKFGNLNFGVPVPDPESLFDHGYDVVICTGGKHSLPDEWRQPRGLDTLTSDAGDVLVIKFSCGAEVARNYSLEQSSLARIAGDGMVFIRPGPSDDTGWIWVVGLSQAFASQARCKLVSCKGLIRFSEVQELLADICELQIGSSLEVHESTNVSSIEGEPSPEQCAAEPCSPSASSTPKMTGKRLGQVLKLLDDLLQPVSITPQITTAQYWRSENAVHCVKAEDGNHRGWLVLAGDAVCGRPFYTGANLNGHFADAVSLIRGTAWSQWDPDGQPFRKYIDRYRCRIGTPAFSRCSRTKVAEHKV